MREKLVAGVNGWVLGLSGVRPVRIRDSGLDFSWIYCDLRLVWSYGVTCRVPSQTRHLCPMSSLSISVLATA